MTLEGSNPKIQVSYGYVWWKAGELSAADRAKVAISMVGKSSDWCARHLTPSPREAFPGNPVIVGCQKSAMFENELYFRVWVVCWVEIKDMQGRHLSIWKLFLKYAANMDWSKLLSCDSKSSGGLTDTAKTVEASEVNQIEH